MTCYEIQIFFQDSSKPEKEEDIYLDVCLFFSRYFGVRVRAN